MPLFELIVRIVQCFSHLYMELRTSYLVKAEKNEEEDDIEELDDKEEKEKERQ